MMPTAPPLLVAAVERSEGEGWRASVWPHKPFFWKRCQNCGERAMFDRLFFFAWMTHPEHGTKCRRLCSSCVWGGS